MTPKFISWLGVGNINLDDDDRCLKEKGNLALSQIWIFNILCQANTNKNKIVENFEVGCRQEETQSGVNHTLNRAGWRVTATSLPPRRTSPLPPSVPPSLEPRVRTVTHRCKFPTHPWNPRNGRKEANKKIDLLLLVASVHFGGEFSAFIFNSLSSMLRLLIGHFFYIQKYALKLWISLYVPIYFHCTNVDVLYFCYYTCAFKRKTPKPYLTRRFPWVFIKIFAQYTTPFSFHRYMTALLNYIGYKIFGI